MRTNQISERPWMNQIHRNCAHSDAIHHAMTASQLLPMPNENGYFDHMAIFCLRSNAKKLVGIHVNLFDNNACDQ